jgi:predicted transcriptional regulator
MIEYNHGRTRGDELGIFRFAIDNPPRATARQATRWDVQDAAYRAAPDSAIECIRRAIAENPSTCDEIEARLGMTHQSASAAINKLMRCGVIRAHGQRPTRSGRMARVWVVVQ